MSFSRRRFLIASAGGLAAAPLIGLPASAAPQIGAAAPRFSATDSNGKTVALDALKGKTVVLEWTNHDCPFVRKHYGAQNMQALQKKWTGQGVVWLTVISSAPGTQGHVSPAQANTLTQSRDAAPSAVLLDPSGKIGRAYGAQVTPHMYVITPAGTLAYMGGIDDKPSTRTDDIKTARNYVDEALTALAAGKPVAVTAARAYGCTIKFES